MLTLSDLFVPSLKFVVNRYLKQKFKLEIMSYGHDIIGVRLMSQESQI